MPTKKPYYKLTIGKKPYESADMRFPCGRIRIEVSSSYPEAGKIIASLCDIRWGAVCEKVQEFFSNCPTEYARPGISLTQPEDHPLQAEIDRLRLKKKAPAPS